MPLFLQDLRFNTFTATVTLTTTSEGILQTSDPATPIRDTVQCYVLAYFQITTGVGVTAVTARIRRGTLVTDTLVGQANAITEAASSTVLLICMASETNVTLGQLRYTLTGQQTGGAANGSVLAGGICVVLV